MKVLERKDWAKTFGWKCTCPRCESKLEAETDDIRHTAGGGDMRESWPESFSIVCEVCDQHISVPVTEIPKYVQHLARERSGR